MPDPKLGANVFLSPIETAAGSQRANLSVSQLLPWLPRLDAQAQQACFEAAALWQDYASLQLKINTDIRTAWYRLYVLDKQFEIYRANQELLLSLIEVANSQVATGKAVQGDVFTGTLEYSKLEERLQTIEQQIIATKTHINRLIGRDAGTPIRAPNSLVAHLPQLDPNLAGALSGTTQMSKPLASDPKHRGGVSKLPSLSEDQTSL